MTSRSFFIPPAIGSSIFIGSLAAEPVAAGASPAEAPELSASATTITTAHIDGSESTLGMTISMGRLSCRRTSCSPGLPSSHRGSGW